MNEENIFSVSMKKIEGTKNDYELITKLNYSFEVLSSEKLKKINDLIFKTFEDIRNVIKE